MPLNTCPTSFNYLLPVYPAPAAASIEHKADVFKLNEFADPGPIAVKLVAPAILVTGSPEALDTCNLDENTGHVVPPEMA